MFGIPLHIHIVFAQVEELHTAEKEEMCTNVRIICALSVCLFVFFFLFHLIEATNYETAKSDRKNNNFVLEYVFCWLMHGHQSNLN